MTNESPNTNPPGRNQADEAARAVGPQTFDAVVDVMTAFRRLTPAQQRIVAEALRDLVWVDMLRRAERER